MPTVRSEGAVFKAHHELIEEIASEVYELKDLLTPTVASLSPPDGSRARAGTAQCLGLRL